MRLPPACLPPACFFPTPRRKPSPFPCRSPSKLRRRSRKLPLKKPKASYETVVETIEEPAAEAAPEAAPETPEETPAAEADNAITRATKADLERPDDLVKLGDFIATAYCVTGQTSTGTQTTVGRTLAVNPHVIPYGTEVWLYLEDGTFAGDFIAEDTGSNMLANSNVIDIYMGEGSYHDCILWGAQNVEVYIRATAEAEQPAQ